MSTLADRFVARAVGLAEAGRLPDPVVAAGIRRLLRARLRALGGTQPAPGRNGAPIAVATEAANRQHYEVPPEFFERVLGPHLKYSCCVWEPDAAGESLASAERRALDLTMDRARIRPGQRVLDLGCGWGSFSLHAAAAFPTSRFLAVSNSRAQIDFVRRRARTAGLGNVEARLADVNDLAPDGRFARIVSVEMMEHVRNHEELLRRAAGWLAPDGRLFVHVFCHRTHAYSFEAEGPGDWMAKRFFTGGTMPSARTIPAAARPRLDVEASWTVSGLDYARTADAWLANLDAGRDELRGVLADAGEEDPGLALSRWRLFFLAVRETFGFRDGTEWMVAHYRLRAAGGET